MSGNYPALSNFKIRSRNRNLTKYFATGYRGVTIGAESNFLPASGTGSLHVAQGGPIPNDRQYTCDWAWTGTDSDTGFGPPTGSPLLATSKYGCYFIDMTYGFATNDHAGVSALATVGTEDAVIRGTSCKALVLSVAPPNNALITGGYGRQLWRVVQRAVTSDLPEICIQRDYYLPNLNTLLSSTRKRLTIFAVKAENDYRYDVTLIRADNTDAAKFGVAAGTIGVELIGDNNANGSISFEEFYRVTLYGNCAPLTETLTIPQQEWVSFRFIWKRAASYADATTGFFELQMRKATDTKFHTVWKQNATNNAIYNTLYPLSAILNTPDTDNRNVHMGVNGSRIQRIFSGIYGNYEDTGSWVTVKIANEEFWDGIPDE